MKVELLESTENPEEVICKAARNDYMDDFICDVNFEEAMASIGDKEDEIEEKKKTLIHHLLQHGHFGPFEHVQATFAVKGISRSCMAQITRHRHASFDVQSMRYVSFDDVNPDAGEGVVLIPELETVELSGRNAEMSEEYEDVDDEEILQMRNELYKNSVEESFETYNMLLDLGIAPENARMVLPIGTKVNMVFSVNCRMLMHIADMRAAGDAQWEIREMTESILSLAEDWCPITFNYYNDEMKNRKNRLAP